MRKRVGDFGHWLLRMRERREREREREREIRGDTAAYVIDMR